jgi:hypothetical protein
MKGTPMKKLYAAAIAAALLTAAIATPSAASTVYCPPGGTRITVEGGVQAGKVRIDGVRVSYEVNNDRMSFDRASTGAPITVRFCVKAGPDFSSGIRKSNGYEVPGGILDITRFVIYGIP